MYELTARNQEEFEAIPIDFDGRINVAFGTKDNPAIIKRKWKHSIVILGDSYVNSYDNVKLFVTGSAVVNAYDATDIEAIGNSKINAYDSSFIKAYGNSYVKAYDNATVYSFDSSTVEPEEYDC